LLLCKTLDCRCHPHARRRSLLEYRLGSYSQSPNF
jgi:hypothetical protein